MGVCRTTGSLCSLFTRSLTFVETTEQLVKISAVAASRDGLRRPGLEASSLRIMFIIFWQITHHKQDRTARSLLLRVTPAHPPNLWSRNIPCYFIYPYTITAHFKNSLSSLRLSWGDQNKICTVKGNGPEVLTLMVFTLFLLHHCDNCNVHPEACLKYPIMKVVSKNKQNSCSYQVTIKK